MRIEANVAVLAAARGVAVGGQSLIRWGTLAAGAMFALGTLGCVSRPSKLEAPTPAAEGDSMVRPFLAPLELTDNPLPERNGSRRRPGQLPAPSSPRISC